MNNESYPDILLGLETAAHRAYKRGMQTGNGGNLSAKILNQDLMIVKSSGGSFIDCSKTGSGFVLTDLDGNIKSKTSDSPTREVFLHGLIYKLRPNIGGIMHCHSPWAISWSFTKNELPVITQHLKLKFNCPIPIIEIPSPVVRPEDEHYISELLNKNPKLPAFILLGHGIVALGKDILEAEHNAELVEETAKVTIMYNIMEKLGIIINKLE